jgi:hypothetical protein
MPATNAIWCDDYLEQYAQAILQGIAAIPRWATVYQAPVNLVPNVDFPTANPDTTVAVDVSLLWTYTLLGSHILQATCTANIVFPASYAGRIYYGACLYTDLDVLANFSPFGMPYVVPAGGTTLQLVPLLNFGDCSSNP